jgi:hypothetical protein
MRQIGELRENQRHLWRAVRGMEGHAAQLTGHEQQLRFLWRDIEALDGCLDDLKRRLFNIALGVAATAVGLVVSLILQQAGLQ